MAVKELCALWACGCCVVFVGLFVGFHWPVSTWLRIGVLEAEGVAVVGVTWPLPSGLSSGPLKTLNTFAFSSHTPVTEVIKI